MNKTIYHYKKDNKQETEILKSLCLNFLINLYKQKIDKGLANITINEINKTITLNEIE